MVWKKTEQTIKCQIFTILFYEKTIQKSTYEIFTIVIHLQKFITIFYEEHLEKSITIFPTLISALQIARSTVPKE